MPTCRGVPNSISHPLICQSNHSLSINRRNFCNCLHGFPTSLGLLWHAKNSLEWAARYYRRDFGTSLRGYACSSLYRKRYTCDKAASKDELDPCKASKPSKIWTLLTKFSSTLLDTWNSRLHLSNAHHPIQNNIGLFNCILHQVRSSGAWYPCESSWK